MAEEEIVGLEELGTLDERLTPERIMFVDVDYLSPRERADRLHTMLQMVEEDLDFKLTRWDYLCFAVEFIGQFAISFFSHDRIFMSTSKLLGKWLYNMHYFYPAEVYGPPKEGERK
jgi:hypothetical protein